MHERSEPLDFFQVLPPELLMHLLSFLSGQDLLRTRLVCRYWCRVASEPQLYKQLCRRTNGQFSNDILKHALDDVGANVSLPQPGRFRTDTLNPTSWFQLYQELRYLERRHDDYVRSELIKTGHQASTTDHPQQDINQTLARGPHFWSSTGSQGPNANEYLIYELVQPVCVVTAVELVPFKALFQRGFPIYAPQQMQVSVGYRPDHMHWTGPRVDVENNNIPQTYVIEPYLVTGGYVRLDLYGKCQTQPLDDLFYTVLNTVRVFGIPVGVLGACPTLSRAALDHAIDIGGLVPAGNGGNAEALVEWFQQDIEETKLRWSTERDIRKKAAELLRAGRWSAAVDLVIERGMECGMRNEATLSMFVNASPQPSTGGGPWDGGAAGLYLQALLRKYQRLEETETIYYAKIWLANNGYDRLRPMIAQGYLVSSERFGDLLRDHGWEAERASPAQPTSSTVHHPRGRRAIEGPGPRRGSVLVACLEMAVLVYSRASAWDKLIGCFVDLGRYWLIVRFAISVHHQVDWPSLVQQVFTANGRPAALQFASLVGETFATDSGLHQSLATTLSIVPAPNQSALSAIREAAQHEGGMSADAGADNMELGEEGSDSDDLDQ